MGADPRSLVLARGRRPLAAARPRRRHHVRGDGDPARRRSPRPCGRRAIADAHHQTHPLQGGVGMANETPTGPLTGDTVIDLSRALAGPHAGMWLGDLGARKNEGEKPGGGRESRPWGPPFVGPDVGSLANYFSSSNRKNDSIALDLKADPGKATLAGLSGRADVLIEKCRSGV